MTRVRSSNSRCSDLVRYMLGAASVSSNFSDKFYSYDGEAYNEDVNNIFLDFENCMPTEPERHLFQMLEHILDDAFSLEADLAEYNTGATAHIKRALQNPSDNEIQKKVFLVVCSFITRIKAYYELAKRIEQTLPNLLWNLCSGPLPPVEQIDSSQALCKQLARIVDFVFRFDCLKMSTPALQNDFSFYRRVLSRTSDLSSDVTHQITSNGSSQSESTLLSMPAVVPLELANTISLFLASPTPMLNSLSQATVAFVREHPDLPVTNTTETLTTVVQICRHMLERKDFYDKISTETRDFVLRVMVGSLILFDHIDDNMSSRSNGNGAFSRNSPIDLRAIVRLIKMNENEQQLMNALRYTSKHYNDADTPKSIRALFN